MRLYERRLFAIKHGWIATLLWQRLLERRQHLL
jgi:hypothetical protein